LRLADDEGVTLPPLAPPPLLFNGDFTDGETDLSP